MSKAKGAWSKVDHAYVREVALISQRNLVRALRDQRLVDRLRKRKYREALGMADRRIALPVAEFGSEMDQSNVRETILRLGGYMGELTGREETDVYALSIWLADALQLFAKMVERLVRNHFPVSVRGGLLEGRMALWAQIEDLDALVSLAAPVLPVALPIGASGEIHQARLWDEPLQEQERRVP